MNPQPRDAWPTTRPPPADETPAAADATAFSRRGSFARQVVGDDEIGVTRDEFEESMGHVLDRLDDLKDAVQRDLPDLMGQAMSKAMQEVLERPETAKVVLSNMRKAATQEAIEATGRGVFAALRSLFSKWLLIALVLVTLAGVAGWQPAVTAARAIFGTARP